MSTQVTELLLHETHDAVQALRVLHYRLDVVIKAAQLSQAFLDQPKDRLWHAEDNTWWKRKGNQLFAADPPPGWQMKPKPERKHEEKTQEPPQDHVR